MQNFKHQYRIYNTFYQSVKRKPQSILTQSFIRNKNMEKLFVDIMFAKHWFVQI